MPWLLLFFIVPIVEMYLLITVAGYIDALPTIGLVMLTAVVGVALLRQQGLSTLMRGMQRSRQGQMPAREMAEGLLLAIAGALLITPGFATDGIGFTLLYPPARRAIAASMLKRVMVMATGQGHAGRQPPSDAAGSSGNGGDSFINRKNDKEQGATTLEGEFERRKSGADEERS